MKPPAASPEFFSPRVVEARRFYLDLNPPPSQRLVVVCGGVERVSADYSIHRLSFPFFAIEYVARGQGKLKLRGRKHPLNPGAVFSYGPRVPHQIASHPNDSLLKYFVDFTGTQAGRMLRACQLPPGTIGQVFPPTEMEGIFEELIACGLRRGRHTAVLASKLLECLALKIQDARAPFGSAGTLSFATYQHCRQHIQRHFLRLRTLAQIAAECHVDAAYLCRLFRRYDHQSPYRFLLRLKMNAAAERLQSPGALVKQVAEQIGFTGPFHFSRAFKSVFGVPPETFRRIR
jgi:AraC-like DNA-binding protein/quercetin dioxygenase-like cupin family protein